ncbi:MAG: hypothetical protein R2712_06630 [Vicinamibacterales bacterium]
MGLAVATRCGGEIIECDSTAVFQRFDIGTDKVPESERAGIPHHLIDTVPPTADYNAADFGRDAARAVREIHARRRLPCWWAARVLLPRPDAGALSGRRQGRLRHER